MHEALDELCKQAAQSVDDGYNYIILSDRGVDETHAAIPSLLAVSAVHHYLIDAGKRVQTALIVESGEIREVMHAALLLGYGASALCPYLTYAILDFLDKGKKYACAIYQDGKNADYEKNPKSYQIIHKTVKKGDVLKIKEARGGGFAISLLAK